MGQNLVMVCNRCKTFQSQGCRFSFISKEQVQDYFYAHKGHEIRAIGDDGGWDWVLGKLIDKGYKRETSRAWDFQEIKEGVQKGQVKSDE